MILLHLYIHLSIYMTIANRDYLAGIFLAVHKAGTNHALGYLLVRISLGAALGRRHDGHRDLLQGVRGLASLRQTPPTCHHGAATRIHLPVCDNKQLLIVDTSLMLAEQHMY